MKPVLFISYSHKDESLKEQLLQQVKVLESEGLIAIWIDDRITAGSEWLNEINEALLQADVAVFLITANFLTSKFILEKEIPELLKRRLAGGLSLFPIIGTDCPWQEVSWLMSLNVRPKNGTPVWTEKGHFVAEQYLAQIAREIASSVRKPQQTSPPVKSAAQIVETNFKNTLSSSESMNHRQIVSVINEAIAHGFPVYNQGDIKGCEEIYYFAARRLLTQLHSSLPSPKGVNMAMMDSNTGSLMPDLIPTERTTMKMGVTSEKAVEPDGPILLGAVRYELRRTLEYVEQIRTRTPDDAAWDLRLCFDRILLLSEGYELATSLALMNDIYSRSEIRSYLRRSISKFREIGIEIYLHFHKDKIKDNRCIMSCGIFFLLVSRQLHKVLLREKELIPKSRSGELAYLILDNIIHENEEVTDRNAMLIAWDARLAFEQYLH